MRIRKGWVYYAPRQAAWVVRFSRAKSPAGFWVMLRSPERYSKWEVAMNEYREHDRKVREYVAANA